MGQETAEETRRRTGSASFPGRLVGPANSVFEHDTKRYILIWGWGKPF